MLAVSKILAGGVAFAALASAAPAAAQYYPGYGYGYGNNGNVLGQVIGQVLGANQYGYGYNGAISSQAAVQRCSAAVEQRINRDYGYRQGGYGGYGGYGGGYGGYNGYAAGNGRVLGVTRIDRRNKGLRVRGVATANAYAAGYGSPYGGGYGGYGGGYAPQGELSFKCDVDYRGYISDIDLDRNGYRGY